MIFVTLNCCDDSSDNIDTIFFVPSNRSSNVMYVIDNGTNWIDRTKWRIKLVSTNPIKTINLFAMCDACLDYIHRNNAVTINYYKLKKKTYKHTNQTNSMSMDFFLIEKFMASTDNAIDCFKFPKVFILIVRNKK